MLPAGADIAFIVNLMRAQDNRACEFTSSHSKLAWNLASLLLAEKIMQGCEIIDHGSYKQIKASPMYWPDQKPVILKIKPVSRNGEKIPVSANDALELAARTDRLNILHTSAGLLTAQQAGDKRLGGHRAYVIHLNK
ncbi:MAG TPA: 30S ribosomal protein S8 [Alphaproteobacteria bacterium]|nr:30S ribosomal protein S8 [Rhodospirillaceae bacterium]HRJ12851.1 30S ribosomal protein S8 [Alphaproteobacteria bacterium]